ncbi:uncharacterized protein CC84DRAFT_1252184 [Paraphaeosphaeria sporulosa]|uniref:Uncharacterized protein n=1 Tax=Paraphaeosphaeria sporulosa TaxID=1460663 RepID=A0A177C2S1_9PLEO|nr:uncharacterized protein CC84DRAFT_1252184 [Paraphaeosphaeria sporulosa]OAG02084.1 hypothetical protein CC84DRAFT_1252184 [Paraphaeosphaeria sporulosa]
MRVLITFPALWSIRVLFANAIDCYTLHHPNEYPVRNTSQLNNSLDGPVIELCGTGGTHTIAHQTEGVSFSITRTTPQSFKECKESFVDIISQCVNGLGLRGGELEGANGTLYRISFEDPADRQLVARRARGGRSKSTRPKATRPKKIIPKKTTPKKTKKKSPNKRPKKSYQKSHKSTSDRRETTSTSPTRAKPTKSCKQMYALAAKAAKVEALTNEKSTTALAKRGEYSIKVPIVEKRTSKPGGNGCAFPIMDALDYPEAKKMPSDAKYYGFSSPLVCDAFGFKQSERPAPGFVQGDYQIEHVLEWQVVTKFFDWLKLRKFSKSAFDNPDRNALDKNGKRRQIGFCEYLKVTWDNPTPPTFKLAFSKDDQERTALGHIQWAYPGKNHFEKEFVYLQTTVNAPAKQQMWDFKDTNRIYGDKTSTRFYKDKTTKKNEQKLRVGMPDLIRGHKAFGTKFPQKAANIDDSRAAYLQLKWIYGARRYLKHPDIKKIFKIQKERIGGVLDALDTEMENHPKETKKGTQDAWKRQGLKKLWDEYMDMRFEMAKERSVNDMDTYIRLLENVWLPKSGEGKDTKKDPKGKGKGKGKGKATSGKAHDDVNLEKDRTVFFAQIKELEKKWLIEKAEPWNAPWL